MTAEAYQPILCALAIWREARGARLAAKVGVKHVLLNRVAHPTGPYRHCPDLVSTILCPLQFSSFNRTDPNASKLPNPNEVGDWKAWEECCQVVDDATKDPTMGATHYHTYPVGDPHWPAWATPDRLTVTIDTFRFYRLA